MIEEIFICFVVIGGVFYLLFEWWILKFMFNWPVYPKEHKENRSAVSNSSHTGRAHQYKMQASDTTETWINKDDEVSAYLDTINGQEGRSYDIRDSKGIRLCKYYCKQDAEIHMHNMGLEKNQRYETVNDKLKELRETTTKLQGTDTEFRIYKQKILDAVDDAARYADEHKNDKKV
ncbi:MAG: hypothetical protein FWD37_02120 [Methanomassiliicoccaceae archaeon]|nr:hypothetical protein [Methanomassiliicoccaceae archaeon]